MTAYVNNIWHDAEHQAFRCRIERGGHAYKRSFRYRSRSRAEIAAAEASARAWCRLMEDAAAGLAIAEPAVTLADAVKAYLERLRLLRRSEDTVDYYQRHLEPLQDHLQQGVTLRDIVQRSIDGYVRWRLAGDDDHRAVGSGSVNKELRALRTVYRHAEVTPAWRMPPLTHHPRERWERRPREDGRRQYLPIATRVLIGYWTGSRPEAIDALRWRDLDLQRGLLVIPSTKGHPNVPCPLVPQLVDHLRARRAALAPAAGELVLAAPRTGTRAVNWRPPWRRVLRIANRRLEPHERIPEATALHVLRHSRITHLLLAGTSPQVVAQITGTSIVMIARRYAHVLVRGLEAEVARSREHPSIQAIEGYASGRNFRPIAPLPVRQEQDTPRRKSLRRKASS